ATVPLVNCDALSEVSLLPLPLKLPEMVFDPLKIWFAFRSATLPESRPSASVPLVNWDALREVKPVPFPLKSPLKSPVKFPLKSPVKFPVNVVRLNRIDSELWYLFALTRSTLPSLLTSAATTETGPAPTAGEEERTKPPLPSLVSTE